MDIMSVFDPTGGGADVAHAGTFNANPLTMRAGEVVMLGSVVETQWVMPGDEVHIDIEGVGGALVKFV